MNINQHAKYGAFTAFGLGVRWGGILPTPFRVKCVGQKARVK